MRIALIDATVSGLTGSMSRYCGLVQAACRGAGDGVQAQRVPVGMPAALAAIRPASVGTWLNHAWMSAACRRIAAGRWDAFHLIDGSLAYLLRWLPAARTVVTVHDLIPWRQMRGLFPGVRPPSGPARRLIVAGLRRISGAAAIVADSRATLDDLALAGVEGRNVTVVHPALDASLSPRASAVGRPQPSECSLLHVGHSGFYKNRPTLLRVVAVLAREAPWRLTLAGEPPTAAERYLASELGILDRIDAVARPDDVALARLYRCSSLLLFPSLYEGFGWPPLEAMACGCPVVCSNAGSLPEVVGDAALRTDPLDLDAMASHCRRMRADPAFAAALRDRGLRNVERFSLTGMAEGLTAAYRAAVRGGTP